MTTMPDFASYPTTRHALAAALGFYGCGTARQLAHLLGVGEGIPLLAILGLTDRSPGAIGEATRLTASSVMFGQEHDTWREAVRARATHLGMTEAEAVMNSDGRGYAEMPRPARPIAPVEPLVFAPEPDWLSWYMQPRGSAVAPDHEIELKVGEIHQYKVALDGIILKLDPSYFVFTDPPQGSLRYRSPTPLPAGAHTLAIWYEEDGVRQELFSWEFRVSDDAQSNGRS